MECFILAGGMGTRLRKKNFWRLPKPLIKIAGKPILEWQILQCKKAGITNITIISGYKGEKIKRHFKDGKKWGVHIDHLIEKYPMGTAGALQVIQRRLPQSFVLLFGDIIFNMNLAKLIDRYQLLNDLQGLLVTHHSDHPKDSSCIRTENHVIKEWFNKGETTQFSETAAGIMILKKDLFTQQLTSPVVDLDKDILKTQIESGLLKTYYDEFSFIKDIGTPDRFDFVEAYMLTHPAEFR